MKKCFKCGIEKELTEFYKHPAMADGTVNKCKECNKKDVTKNRNLKSDYYIAYDRERGGGRVDYAYTKEYRERYPNKYRAHSLVASAIKKGSLVRPDTCPLCGDTYAIIAHHCDYSKPLEVDWMCEFCHKAWHKEHGEALNAV